MERVWILSTKIIVEWIIQVQRQRRSELSVQRKSEEQYHMYSSIRRSWISQRIIIQNSPYQDSQSLRNLSDSIPRSGSHVSIIRKLFQNSNLKRTKLSATNSEERQDHWSRIIEQEKLPLSNEHILSRISQRRSMSSRNNPLFSQKKLQEWSWSFFYFRRQSRGNIFSIMPFFPRSSPIIVSP